MGRTNKNPVQPYVSAVFKCIIEHFHRKRDDTEILSNSHQRLELGPREDRRSLRGVKNETIYSLGKSNFHGENIILYLIIHDFRRHAKPYDGIYSR